MKIIASIMSGTTNVEKNTIRAFYDGLLKYYINRCGISTEDNDAERQLKKYHNIELVLSYETEFKDCDIGIIFGSIKDRSGVHHTTKQNLKKAAKVLIHIETPLIGRVVKDIHDYNYYRIGVNGFLYKQGIFYDQLKDMNRFTELQQKLNFNFQGWNPKVNGDILLLTQLPGDASLRDQNHAEWIIDTIRQIRLITDRSIVIRMHPALSEKGKTEFINSLSPLLISNYEKIKINDGHSSSLTEDLSNASVSISYTSGSSIDSILAGVPVIAIDQGNFAYDISSNRLDELFNPKMVSTARINQWLNGLCNSQWSVEEMYQGLPQERLIPIAEDLICTTL